jgi:glycopeptide antibiotics resistance protein
MIYLRISPRTIFAICLLTSLAIELIQLRIPGRVNDPIDVLMNTFGALLALIYANWKEKAKCI